MLPVAGVMGLLAARDATANHSRTAQTTLQRTKGQGRVVINMADSLSSAPVVGFDCNGAVSCECCNDSNRLLPVVWLALLRTRLRSWRREGPLRTNRRP